MQEQLYIFFYNFKITISAAGDNKVDVSKPIHKLGIAGREDEVD